LVFVIPAKAGIQTQFLQKLRKQGTIKELDPVFTGNPGFRIKCGMTRMATIWQTTGKNQIEVLIDSL
jgi:hypothetical protein